MAENKLIIHGIYKHYKGDYYIVEGVATHTETGEELVLYRGLYNSSDGHGQQFICARPKDMFLSEVDHEKYPDVKQTWRFELQDIASVAKDFAKKFKS